MTEVSPSARASLRPLARLHFFVYAAVGIALPYLPLHCRALGMSGAEVGWLAGIGPLATIFVPPLWGYAADKARRAGALPSIAAGGSALAFVPLLWARTPLAMAPWLSVQALFGSLVSMLADRIAPEKVGGAGGRHSRVRLWGSPSDSSTAAERRRRRPGSAPAPRRRIEPTPGSNALPEWVPSRARSRGRIRDLP
jgi:MFS family permease